MIIERPRELKRIQELKKWILIYGRRKTGKTFLVQNFVKADEYFFVKTDRSIFTKDGRSISYETLLELLQRGLGQGQTIAVDEFHRLGNNFFDFLHFLKKEGRLILISSTLFLSKKLISGKSPLLGLFAEVPISLVSLEDSLHYLRKFSLPNRELLELAALLREPIAISYFDEKKKARETIAQIVMSSAKSIPALVGEIFLEEERELSVVYEGILRAVAAGKIGTGEMAGYLFSKKIIQKDDPSVIQQYLSNLLSFGVLRRIALFNKKKFVYKICSPLARIYYYADEKYNLSERAFGEEELQRIINELMPRIAEDEVRMFLAETLGLQESVMEGRDFEVDGVLLKFKKPEIALEVKWGKLSREDIRKTEEKLGSISARRKVLFVPDKKDVKGGLEILDVNDLLKMARAKDKK